MPPLTGPALERIFTIVGDLDAPLSWSSRGPDYTSLKSCSLVARSWRQPAQAVLAKHVRICSPSAMKAIRSREAKRQLGEQQGKTEVLEVERQSGMDVYWLLDRFPRIREKGLRAFRLVYDPLLGGEDGQERDEEWLEWEVLRHPSLAGITNLFCKADLRDPADLSLLSLPLTDLTLGNLPLEHSPALHKALFTGCKPTLRSISLDFLPTLSPPKAALDSLIEEFQVVAVTLEHLVFLGKPDISFVMSLHSKMNSTKMPLFYSSTYPLLRNALAPFNILALAVVNNGTSLAEFRFSEADPHNPPGEEEHEALVLKYIAAFGSRLDSFNMMGRKFRFVFPREWSARFVRQPEIARFLDRAGARGCDVHCGAEQKFASTAKAMEKRKGKRVAQGGGEDDSPSPSDLDAAEQVVQQAFAAAGGKGKEKAPSPSSSSVPAAGKGKGKGKAVDKGKGKAVDKGKGKAVDKGKGKAVDKGKGKGKAVEQ
ncbi:hypothetical protein JCM10213_006218 [Rhodosporidiobolus nylandii]